MERLNRLRAVMRFQAIVFLLYGAGFVLVPAWLMDTIFAWEIDGFWPRLVGVPFLGVAWLEWNVAARVQERLDLVWPFAFIPGLFLVVFVWERADGTYPGSEIFWWVSLAVTLFFFVAVIATRPTERQLAEG